MEFHCLLISIGWVTETDSDRRRRNKSTSTSGGEKYFNKCMMFYRWGWASGCDMSTGHDDRETMSFAVCPKADQSRRLALRQLRAFSDARMITAGRLYD